MNIRSDRHVRPALLLCTFLLGLVAGCGGNGGADAESMPVQVENFRYSRLPTGERLLTGELANLTGETIHNAQIQVSLFDADNRRISSVLIDVHDLAPYGRSPFREAVDGDLRIQRARVQRVIVL